MDRRNFLKNGAQAALIGFAVVTLGFEGTEASAAPGTNSGPVIKPNNAETPEILKSYTTADHRKRFESIAFGEKRIAECVRKHLVTSYIPGHAVFAMSGSKGEPNEKDDQALADLRAIGIGIIQPWREWATCWGKNYLVAKNPDGFKRMVKMVQSHGIKGIP